MKIIIKPLRGGDCTLNVTPATTVLEIKQQLENILNIPLANQILLRLGRTLSDENSLADYPNINDGTKLNLIELRPKKESLQTVINRSFKKYYNEQQSERLTKEFMLDFEKKLQQLSLDDIERLADSLICQ